MGAMVMQSLVGKYRLQPGETTLLLIHLSADPLTKVHLCQVKRERCGVVGVRVTQIKSLLFPHTDLR